MAFTDGHPHDVAANGIYYANHSGGDRVGRVAPPPDDSVQYIRMRCDSFLAADSTLMR